MLTYSLSLLTASVLLVCSYFTKVETECSQAIMNAAKEDNKENLSIREGLKKLVLPSSPLEK